MATGGGYNVSLKTLLSAFSVIGAVISFLSFNIGRASVVSDLRKEISEKYVERIQYARDQDQLALRLRELSSQNSELDAKITRILILLTKERKMVADNLIAEPD